MAWQASAALRNAMGDAITTAIGNAGLLRVLDGTKPAAVATAQSGTLGSVHTLASPFAPGAAAGVLSPTLPANVNAGTTITATYYRALTSAAVAVTQGDVVSSGSGIVLNPSSNVLTSGQAVQVTSWSITLPGA